MMYGIFSLDLSDGRESLISYGRVITKSLDDGFTISIFSELEKLVWCMELRSKIIDVTFIYVFSCVLQSLSFSFTVFLASSHGGLLRRLFIVVGKVDLRDLTVRCQTQGPSRWNQ